MATANPPSRVLAMKVHTMQQEDVRNVVSPYVGLDGPIFVQNKGNYNLAFVEFPNIEAAMKCLEYINDGSILAANGMALSAQYSNRTKVTQDKTQTVEPMMGGHLAQNLVAMSALNSKRPRDGCTAIMQGMPPKRGPAVQDILQQNVSPSPVLCIKNDLDQEDLDHFLNELHMQQGLPKFVDFMRIQGKNMCFVQYQTDRDATEVLCHFQQQGYVTPRGTTMIAEFSKRRSIERKAGSQMSAEDIQVTKKEHKEEARPSTVLIFSLRPNSGNKITVSAENMLLPCARYGIVTKIIVWGKQDKNDINALVQYSHQDFADYARSEMDGTVMGEFRVQVRYSEKNDIEIESNNERARDFSNPWLGKGNLKDGLQPKVLED